MELTNEVSRKTVLSVLEHEWAEYVPTFQSFTAEQKAAVLKEQGYPRLADLLAHFTAWWQNGMQTIRKYHSDPDFQPPEIDVDAFNARVIENAKNLSESEAVAAFEETRLEFIQFVKKLSDGDFDDKRIRWQLEIELMGHYEEHRI